MALFELVDPLQAVPPTHQNRRSHPLHHVPHVTTGHAALVDRRQSRVDGPAAVMAEHDHKRHVEHRNRVLDGAQHGRVDDVTGGADHEHVAQALVEDDLGGHAAVRAPEDDRRRLLPGSQAGTVIDALTGVQGLAGDESLVTLTECFPGGYRIGVGHASHCAATFDDLPRTHTGH